MSNLYNNLKKMLDERGLNFNKLSKMSGVSTATLTDIKTGKVQHMSSKNLERISKALEVPIDVLLADPDAPIMVGVPQSATIPLYGSIPAGIPTLALADADEYLVTDLPNPQEYFALRVKGQSMIGAGIVDGCSVICHIQNFAEEGNIVACLVNGEEATLKRFRQQGNTVILCPENTEYSPIIVPITQFISGEAKILGVVKQIRIDI